MIEIIILGIMMMLNAAAGTLCGCLLMFDWGPTGIFTRGITILGLIANYAATAFWAYAFSTLLTGALT